MKTTFSAIMSVAVCGVTMFLNGSAWAGAKDTPPVTVGSSYAGGSMVGARYSGDSNQYIGCSYTVSWAATPWTSCSAKDKTGKSFFCYSADPKWREVLQTVTDSSYFYITADSGGQCHYISIDNSSKHLK